MQVDPKDEWKVMLQLGAPILLILLLCVAIVTVSVLSFFYNPLIPLVAFFVSIFIIHIFLMPWIYKTKLKGIGVILLYTILVDSIILSLSKQFTITLLFPPIIIGFFLGTNSLFEYLMSYHTKRNLLSRFQVEYFSNELEKIYLELDYRNIYNTVIAFAFSFTGIIAFIYKWNSKTIMFRFAEYSILAIAIICFYKIVRDSFKIGGIFDSDIFHSHVILSGHYHKTIYRGISGAIDEEMKNNKLESQERAIDYFDRAAEVRKLRYYSSLCLLFIACFYLYVYTLFPKPIIPLHLKWVVVICTLIGLLTVQLPYFIGQKKLAMSIVAKYSGTEHREMLDLLGKNSPAWNFLHTSEILGIGIVPGVFIWLLDLSCKGFVENI